MTENDLNRPGAQHESGPQNQGIQHQTHDAFEPMAFADIICYRRAIAVVALRDKVAHGIGIQVAGPKLFQQLYMAMQGRVECGRGNETAPPAAATATPTAVVIRYGLGSGRDRG